MKKYLGIAICLILVSALFMPTHGARAADVSSYSSGLQIQNLSQTDAANFTITFYNRSDGSIAATTPSAQIPAGSYSSFFTLNSLLSSAFDGSAIVSSDQPVAATSLLFGNTNQEHVDTYTGFTSGATTLYLPLIQKNNSQIYTWFNVQNTGSADAHITVSYAGTTCTETATIKQGAAWRSDQHSTACLADGVYAATITSDQPIAAVVVEVPTTYQTLKPMIEAYTAFTTAGVTNPVFPSVSSGWYGSVNGIRIMNTGTLDTTVTMTFTPSAGFPGAVCTETKLIAHGQSVSFANGYSRLMAPACRTLQSGYTAFVGVGKVTGNTAGQTLVGISHQNNSINAQGAVYDSFDPATGTTSLAFPLVVDRYFGATSGLTLYNAGVGSAHVVCTFTGSGFTLTQDIAEGTGTANPLKNLIGDSYLGAAHCTADKAILGVGSYNTQVTATDGRGSYLGINH